MRRAVIGCASAWEGECHGFRQRVAVVTLTYARANEWRRKHVTGALSNARKYIERRGETFRYEWVAEIQGRRLERTGDAVVHYHLIVWLPGGLELPKFDDAGWWPHGMTQVEYARNPVGYCAKYASKLGDCEKFPRGLRLSGRGGFGPEVARAVRYWVSPRYVRERFGVGCDPRRCKGGGWVDVRSGEVISPDEVPRFTEWVTGYIGGSDALN